MKQETRQKYEDVIEGGKKLLQTAMDQGKIEPDQYMRWGEIWRDLESVGNALTAPLPNTKECASRLNSLITSARRLVGENALIASEPVIGPGEQEEAPSEIKQAMMNYLQLASDNVMGAFNLALAHNPVMENITLVQDMKKMAQNILTMQNDVSKLRGF